MRIRQKVDSVSLVAEAVHLPSQTIAREPVPLQRLRPKPPLTPKLDGKRLNRNVERPKKRKSKLPRSEPYSCRRSKQKPSVLPPKRSDSTAGWTRRRPSSPDAQARREAAEQKRREADEKKQQAAEERRIAAEQQAKARREAAEQKRIAAEQKRKQAAAAEEDKKKAQAARAKQAQASVQTAKPRATFSLANLFGGSDKVDESSDSSIEAQARPSVQPKKMASPPRGTPIISDWKQNRDGSITGRISGGTGFKEGEKITTSPIGGKAIGGAVVQTASGSK